MAVIILVIDFGLAGEITCWNPFGKQGFGEHHSHEAAIESAVILFADINKVTKVEIAIRPSG